MQKIRQHKKVDQLRLFTVVRLGRLTMVDRAAGRRQMNKCLAAAPEEFFTLRQRSERSLSRNFNQLLRRAVCIGQGLEYLTRMRQRSQATPNDWQPPLKLEYLLSSQTIPLKR